MRRQAGFKKAVPAGLSLLLSCVVLSACNNPASRDKQDGRQASPPGKTTTATGGAKGSDNKKKYSWKDSLPKGDPGVNPEADLYSALYEGNCGSAQEWLNQPPNGISGWSALSSPRDVLLYQAGIYFCRGDVTAAKKMFQRAGRLPGGWEGLAGDKYPCRVYKAAASVVNQRPQQDFPCPGGSPPPWGDPQANPLNPAETVGPEESEEPQTPGPESTETTPSSSENNGLAIPTDNRLGKPKDTLGP